MLGRGNAGETLADLIEAQRVDPAKVDLRVNYQALSTMAVRGSAASDWREMEKPFAKVVGGLMGRGFKGPFVLADGRPVHDAGGSEAQELAFALALALAYLRTLEAGGIALDTARAAISFRLDRRCRPVPDDGEIPRAAAALGARRSRPAGLRQSRSSSPPRPHGGC